MAIYEIQPDGIVQIEETSFGKEGLHERKDLQRLLRDQIDVISTDTLVISEEFGEWEDSKRRIDLLGIDKDANLIVVELKSTEGGGHMELQAVRYAAMVSTMTFEKAVDVYAKYLQKTNAELDAQESMLEFLGWEEPDEERFAQDVRIVLVAADFSKEITTAVMWLNERDLDIHCVRMKPYSDSGRVLVDVQQVIPLPEAEEYQVSIREKAQKEKLEHKDRAERYSLRYEFWRQLLNRSKEMTHLFSNVSPCEDSWTATGSGISLIIYIYSIGKHTASVQLALEREKSRNKADFDLLHEHREEIEEVFGGPLEWARRDNYKKSCIQKELSLGGYRSEQESWPEIQEAMIDNMIRLEKAFSPHMDKLRSGGQHAS